MIRAAQRKLNAEETVNSTQTQTYSLGTSDSEIARLDAQANTIATATALLLRSAGIAPGMRVLDLGTGIGHVAFQLADLVGAAGEVVAIDQAAPLLDVAEQRRASAGLENVHFVEADVRTFRHHARFDAVVGRLILFHLPDRVDILRHHLGALSRDGLTVMIDFDVGSARTEPSVPLFATAVDWITRAFRHAGANPVIGTQLARLLQEVGLTDVQSFGIQQYLPPDDPFGAALIFGVVNILAPLIVAAGIATEDELGLDTFRARLEDAVQSSRAVALPPATVGAWARLGDA